MSQASRAILILTILTCGLSGARGAVPDTLCIGSAGAIRLKTADTVCCAEQRQGPVEAAPLAGWQMLATDPDHHDCVDIPLPPTRLERLFAEPLRLAVMDLATTPGGAMLDTAAAAPGIPAAADPAVDVPRLTCSTIVLRC